MSEQVGQKMSSMRLTDWERPKERGGRVCKNAMDLVGHTPLVYLNTITQGLQAQIAVKLEYFNPGCSVKDRAGSYMIEKAEREGKIQPGKTVLVEGTSGNMGIGMAWAAAVKGYRLILVMPSTMSLERRTLLRAYGAEFVLVDPEKGFAGVLERVDDILKFIPNSFALNQFCNPDNIEIHYLTTGPEIWDQTEGKVDIVCFGVGSGGTMSGVGRYLKEKNPKIQVFAVEPYESSVINGLPAGAHSIYGIGAGVIPENVKPIYVGAQRVRTEEAVEMAKRLAREEGLLAGISGGANVFAAIQLAKKPENHGKLIVTSLADFGERYLSTILYSDIKRECDAMGITTLDEDREYLTKKLGLQV